MDCPTTTRHPSKHRRGHSVEETWNCPILPGRSSQPPPACAARHRPRPLQQQITARACFQLKHKDGPDADGYQRLSCPAAGERPGLICPLRRPRCPPATGAPRYSSPRPNRPDLPPSDHIAPDTGAHFRQDLPAAPRPGTRRRRLRSPSKASTATPKTPPTKPSPARPPPRPHIAARSIFHRALLIANIARSAPGGPSPPPARPPSPSGHGAAAQASPTTAQTANSARPQHHHQQALPGQASTPQTALSAATRSSAPFTALNSP